MEIRKEKGDILLVNHPILRRSIERNVWYLKGGRRGGLETRPRPGRGHCVVFMGKTLDSHSASLYTQVYKWVPANLMLGVTL